VARRIFSAWSHSAAQGNATTLGGAASKRDISTTEQLLRLQDQVVTGLGGLPGVSDVTVFGSCANGRCDRSSDLDVQATTTDIDRTLHSLHRTLARIDAVELEWAIADAPENWAATIVFEHLSPMQKLDLSIRSAPAGTSVTGRKQLTSGPAPRDRVVRPATVYWPMIGSLEHYTLSHVLGTTRYVKGRRRGHLLSCWRFTFALVGFVIATECPASIADADWVPGGLTTQEYRDADLQLDPAMRGALIGDLDFSGPDAMDRSVILLVNRLTSNYWALRSPALTSARLLHRLSIGMTELLE